MLLTTLSKPHPKNHPTTKSKSKTFTKTETRPAEENTINCQNVEMQDVSLLSVPFCIY